MSDARFSDEHIKFITDIHGGLTNKLAHKLLVEHPEIRGTVHVEYKAAKQSVEFTFYFTELGDYSFFKRDSNVPTLMRLDWELSAHAFDDAKNEEELSEHLFELMIKQAREDAEAAYWHDSYRPEDEPFFKDATVMRHA